MRRLVSEGRGLGANLAITSCGTLSAPCPEYASVLFADDAGTVAFDGGAPRAGAAVTGGTCPGSAGPPHANASEIHDNVTNEARSHRMHDGLSSPRPRGYREPAPPSGYMHSSL